MNLRVLYSNRLGGNRGRRSWSSRNSSSPGRVLSWPTLDLYTKLVVLLLYLAPDNNGTSRHVALSAEAGRVQLPEQQALCF